jgi:hypothetical protein
VASSPTPAATSTRPSLVANGMDETKHESLGKLPQKTPLRRGSLTNTSVAASGEPVVKENSSINWLIDDSMLCYEIPEAQVFQFGYRLGPQPAAPNSEYVKSRSYLSLN